MKTILESARAVQPTRRQAAALTLSGLAVAATTATAAHSAASDLRSVSAAQRAADQQTLLNLINAYRAQNGLGAVKHSAIVASVMQPEAERQVRAGYFSHGTEFIYNSKVQGYSFVREVIALSYNDDLAVLLNFWKSSAPHRAAILAPQANVIGIGLAYGHGTSLPWRVLGNVGIYRYEAGKGPNDYVSKITATPAPTTGFIVRDGIGTYYNANGGAATFGAPTSNEFAGSDRAGAVQNFANGKTIYWTNAAGAKTVTWGTAIGQKFAASGFEGGLGYPVTEQIGGLAGGGAYQMFRKDGTTHTVLWSPASGGAYAIKEGSAISHAWTVRGREAGFGYPTSDEYSVGIYVRQNFTGGKVLSWNSLTGQVTEG